jgi:hypothetical protein
MSHVTGTVQVLPAPLLIGPGPTVFNPAAAPGGTKLLILHFQNPNFAPGDELHVELGYATDVFTAADGPAFWTRPIDVYAFPAGVQITYVAAGPPTGSVELDRFGRGERHAGEPGHASFSNCDPFYQAPAYVEPVYDPFWYCSDPPDWENVAQVTDPDDVRARVARSVGMIVSVEGDHISTCSVTLVDADKVLTAGHCHTPDEALNSSVTFDYLTLADGSRPPGYNPRFYKVKAVLGHENTGTSLDYSLLQLAEAPPSLAPLQMRHDFPALHEAVFGVHHPNGAVKKLSLPHAAGFSEVTGSSAGGINVPSGFDVSGGSSGSGLFDAAGRIVGVLSRGAPCAGSPLGYCPTPNVLADLVPVPPPAVSRDVMLVFDRSGSMSLDDGTGRQKIEAARDAVSLFVQLVRAGTGNRAGLVSFSTSASLPVDFALAAVTAASKLALVGPPPYAGGQVGALTPGGLTSIGGGLDAARAQFPLAGPNPRAVLLLTDGLQNRPPSIADIEPSLAGISVHAIGFGTESSLDGALLSALTAAHDGLYLRAGGGLALEKFFSSAFGNIFESGVLFDPEFDLPADQPAGAPIAFNVCGEEVLTAVAGWEELDASLLLELTTPGGVVVTGVAAGVESADGRSWTFLRVPLPVAGERNGAWSVRVLRPGGGGEFPPPAPALRYFVNVIPSGGPKLLRQADNRRCYTGDVINPLMLLRYNSGGWPDDIEMSLTVTRPDTGIGNVLAQSGLGPAGAISADSIPARQATLLALEQASGQPVARYVESQFELSDHSADNGGLFEPGGTFGLRLPDLLNVEGNYSFHVKARYGAACSGTREHVWSLHAEIGIDPGHTSVTSTTLGDGADGGTNVRLTFTPRDRYGNLLGPGRLDAFTAEPVPGCQPSGPVTDVGGGAYQVDVHLDPGSLGPPQVGIAQPGRTTVVVTPADFKLFVYGVKFVCGVQGGDGDCAACAPVRPGRYATEINILNPTGNEVPVLMRPVPLVVSGAASGREPASNGPGKPVLLHLPAHSASMSDCCSILELVLGAVPAGSVALSIGFLEVVSTVELDVTAVYTANGDAGSAPSIAVSKIASRVLVP